MTVNHPQSGSLAYEKQAREFGASGCTARVQEPHFPNFIPRQSGVSVPLPHSSPLWMQPRPVRIPPRQFLWVSAGVVRVPSGTSALTRSISRVISRSPRKQVASAYAWRVVAGVQRAQIKRVHPCSDGDRNARRNIISFGDLKYPVTQSPARSRPHAYRHLRRVP